jgi:hypothetical protein
MPCPSLPAARAAPTGAPASKSAAASATRARIPLSDMMIPFCLFSPNFTEGR